MKWEAMRWGSERFEWVQLSPGRWGLVGHKAEVFFHDKRGWGALVDGSFLAYYSSRKRAMEAVIGFLNYEQKLREAKAKEVG
jgi:hypothetical protein